MPNDRRALLDGQSIKLRVGEETVLVDPVHLDETALAERRPVSYELPDATLHLVAARMKTSTDVLDTESFAALLCGRRRLAGDAPA